MSNPKTAPDLLRLANALLDRSDGRILALYVALQNVEDEGTPIEEIEPIIAEFVEQDSPVELVTHPASNVARGILDFSREARADLIIVGVQNARKGEFELGPVTRGVTETAPCDVLIYTTQRNGSFEHIVVPVDGSKHARTATRIAQQIGAGFEKSVEALVVQNGDHDHWEGRARLRRSLAGLPDVENIRQSVTTADDPTEGLLARLEKDDLLVIGFENRNLLQKWLFSSFSRRLLDNLTGPLILVSASADEEENFAHRFQRRLNWIMPTLTEIEQDSLTWRANEMAMPTLDFFFLAIIAALIASAGLLLNSAAVIIGAMLIAPFMEPLIAFSIGLTTGRVELLRRALPTISMGVVVALVIAFGFGRIVGMESATQEMLSRSHPSLLDAAVAITAGLIAAYATARKDIPAALAGVAIAAALMPPICTIGLALSAQEYELAWGATLLFLTNIVFISLAGWAIFFWMGMRARLIDQSRKRQYLSWALVTVLALPIIVVLLNLTNRESNTGIVGERLRDAFAPAELVEMRVENEEPLTILATIRTTEAITTDFVRAVQNTLSGELEQPVELRVIVQAVIDPPPIEAD